jgi:tRNA/tmRNA/rRNA uracil-C5-methylase (TrmA/RlmC/RlmD family)
MVVRDEAARPRELLGFYQEQSRTVVPVQSCEAHHPQIGFALAALRPLLFADDALRKFTRFVDVRCTAGYAASDESVMLTLAGVAEAAEKAGAQLELIETRAAALFAELRSRLEDLRVSLHLNVSQDANQAVLSGEQRTIGGDACLTFALKSDGDGDDSAVELRVPPTAFFQVNLDQLQAAHRQIREKMPEQGLLLDLYCGVGTHSIALAGASSDGADISRIVGTDVSESAIDQARENAHRAGLQAEFLAADDADAVQWIEQRTKKRVSDQAAVSVLTNPARAGMSPETVALVGDLEADAIFYLSCEPETLCRDLDRLLDRGFEVRSVEAFDFMPQTDQVETLAVLGRATKSATLNYERAYQPLENRRYAPGVSGPAALPTDKNVERSVWIALVAGEVPKQGFLPHSRSKGRKSAEQQRIKVERLRKVEGNSVVRIHAAGLDDDELRRRLRAWNHPAVGDPDFGDRNANHLARRHGHLDRIALHCVAAQAAETWHTAPIPGQFLAMMRLPRKMLEEFADDGAK